MPIECMYYLFLLRIVQVNVIIIKSKPQKNEEEARVAFSYIDGDLEATPRSRMWQRAVLMK